MMYDYIVRQTQTNQVFQGLLFSIGLLSLPVIIQSLTPNEYGQSRYSDMSQLMASFHYRGNAFGAWDTNGDGFDDAWDTNGDGAPDAWDTDGDGSPNMFDTDHDGKADWWRSR